MACIIFLTEFAEFGSIYDYIHKEHKQPPLSQMLLWAAQVAEGTGQSHVTDKDVTPSPLQQSTMLGNAESLLLLWYFYKCSYRQVAKELYLFKVGSMVLVNSHNFSHE